MKFDKQVTGMAGEYLTLGKLFKKGLQAAVTVGNAKAIDILAYNPMNDMNYNIQVKSLRKKDGFFFEAKNIKTDHVFVFVVLNEFEDNEEYFVIKGSEILKNLPYFFGSTYNEENPSKMSAIKYTSLKEYRDNWIEFEK